MKVPYSRNDQGTSGLLRGEVGVTVPALGRARVMGKVGLGLWVR